MGPTAREECFVPQDDLRTRFSLAMSAMYKNEVPLYKNLIQIVNDVNQSTLKGSDDARLLSIRNGGVAAERLDMERHGAIRLGTPYELSTVRRIFNIIGLHAVGYYDLSVAGLPMHATCFRPISTSSLEKNPFRIFTTLLRPELLHDNGVSDLARSLLSKRNIFSYELLRLLEIAEEQNGELTETQSLEFVSEAMKTFSWQALATSQYSDYQKLKLEHPILADVVCFQSAHINHLTPRTLDISASQDAMRSAGLAIKERIEGPPERKCPILLRQTSFLALEERIKFPTVSGQYIEGTHKARFGEIEERGAAVTEKGRNMYNVFLAKAMDDFAQSHISGKNTRDMDDIMIEIFKAYPDDWDDLRRKRLVYFTYKCVLNMTTLAGNRDINLESLLESGIVEAVPITYEDFLPLSAAGIFQSNLQSCQSKQPQTQRKKPTGDQQGYEAALGSSLLNADRLYSDAEQRSLRECEQKLGLPSQSLEIVDVSSL